MAGNGKKARLYKGKYIIAFYDRDDSFVDSFDTIRELVTRGQGKEPTKQNLLTATLSLSYALKHEDHHTTMLGGKPMTVHLLDIDRESE